MTELWRASASIDTLKKRARILQDIRAFFAKRNVIEVQVPNITISGITEVHIDSIPVNLGHQKAYLHTSPEYPMKRLLASGLGDCYYLGSVFRQGEQGSNHNPEFAMLEWYRIGFEMDDLINEVIRFVSDMLQSESKIARINSVSYSDAFKKTTGIDIFNTTVHELLEVLESNVVDVPEMSHDIDLYLDLLMSTVVIPKLKRYDTDEYEILVIHSYPKSQAALAETVLDPKGNQVAARFEVLVNGLEIANGYQEICDADELEQRFIMDNKRRIQLNKAEMPIDNKLLDAMRFGLPKCSGVALGIDRLLMIALDKTSIDEVITFPINRC